jgi:mRNA interferase MazF
MTCKRGDVVLVAFPNRDGITTKRRPALVLQSNSLSDRLGTVVVAAISSRIDLKGPTRILVTRESPEGRAAGLVQDSQIFVDELRSVGTWQIARVLGHYPAMGEAERALRLLFGL